MPFKVWIEQLDGGGKVRDRRSLHYRYGSEKSARRKADDLARLHINRRTIMKRPFGSTPRRTGPRCELSSNLRKTSQAEKPQPAQTRDPDGTGAHPVLTLEGCATFQGGQGVLQSAEAKCTLSSCPLRRPDFAKYRRP